MLNTLTLYMPMVAESKGELPWRKDKELHYMQTLKMKQNNNKKKPAYALVSYE